MTKQNKIIVRMQAIGTSIQMDNQTANLTGLPDEALSVIAENISKERGWTKLRRHEVRIKEYYANR